MNETCVNTDIETNEPIPDPYSLWKHYPGASTHPETIDLPFISGSLEVPTVDARQRIPASIIRPTARWIAKAFQPRRVILFSSSARGNPRPE
jgi:hypothetical protein